MMAVAVGLAAMALAAGGAVTVGSASSAKLGELAVDAHGRTLYALSPETAGHLLCKSSECLAAWPPLTVSSRKTKLKAGPGVHGHLGILHRSNGMLQVTLRGLPLYRFSGDRAKGAVNGQGIKSFGGTWHVVSAVAAASTTPREAKEPASSEPGTVTSPGYGNTSASGAAGTGGGAPGVPSTPTPATTPPTTTTPTTTTPTTTTPYEYPKEKEKEPEKGW
jgi:predicted lipoprotein with Yx(FWY)xxD motif